MRYLRGFYFFVATLAIYLLLPLLGWGIGAIPAFFALPPLLAYALVVALFGLAVAWQGIHNPGGLRGGHGQEGKRVRRQTVLGYALTSILFGALFLLPFADRRSLAVLYVGQGVRWAGVVLSCLGYTLIFWSGLSLGRLYSAEVTIQKAHHLITTGLYRTIRHPRYLGAICVAFGVSLLFRSWAGLLLSVLLPGLLLQRIKDEEALMHQEFGAEWEEYCQRSWRLLPYVY